MVAIVIYGCGPVRGLFRFQYFLFSQHYPLQWLETLTPITKLLSKMKSVEFWLSTGEVPKVPTTNVAVMRLQ